MAEVNENLTRKVAHLARLDLSDNEVKTYTGQLKEILGYFEQLESLDTSSVEPLVRPHQIETPMRKDQAEQSDASKHLQQGPEIQDQSYKVPSILS